MSDEFDKEAERRKLREKFARDDEKRAHTQRMSELLLKGATMTKRHCETCNDPIFRHDDKEFCPTCNQPAAPDPGSDSSQTEGHTADATSSADATPTAGAATSADATAAPSVNGDGMESPTPGQTQGSTQDQQPPSADKLHGQGGSPKNVANGHPNRSDTSTPSDTVETTERDVGAVRAANSAPTDRAGSFANQDPRASLQRTLARFASAAEATDDPRQAREYLKAAREAAETLEALER